MSQLPKLDLPGVQLPAASPRSAESARATEPTMEARLLEIEALMREILSTRRERRSNKLVFVTAILALAALLSSGTQAYLQWSASRRVAELPMEMTATPVPQPAAAIPSDARTELTLAELAKRSPSLRKGTLQAWWAGEQARQVQRLEAQAKRQTLAGDQAGAALSASRADSIRSSISILADFEKPQPH